MFIWTKPEGTDASSYLQAGFVKSISQIEITRSLRDFLKDLVVSVVNFIKKTLCFIACIIHKILCLLNVKNTLLLRFCSLLKAVDRVKKKSCTTAICHFCCFWSSFPLWQMLTECHSGVTLTTAMCWHMITLTHSLKTFYVFEKLRLGKMPRNAKYDFTAWTKL